MSMKQAAIESLRAVVGFPYLSEDPVQLSRCAVEGLSPWAVVFPGSVEEVMEIVRVAGKENLAVVPRGAGSKMHLGCAPSRLDLIVSTERLYKVTDMDTANLTVTAQAGARFQEIQQVLAGQENRCYLPLADAVTTSDKEICSERENRGCFIPLDPPYSGSATLGGILASASSGPRRLLYGQPRDLVLGLRYVAPNGEVIGMGGKTVKNVSGYDVCKLMIGSYGSLGILCEMTLRALPLPERSATSLFCFSGLSGACTFVDMLFASSLLPAAVEMMNNPARNLLAQEGAGAFQDGGYAVAVAMEGVDEAVNRMVRDTREMAAKSQTTDGLYLEKEDHDRFWDVYSNHAETLSKTCPDLVSVKMSYPISRYRSVVEFLEKLSEENGLTMALFIHAGSGVTRFHMTGARDHTPLDNEKVALCVDRVLNQCRETGGHVMIERAKLDLKRKLPVWGIPGQGLSLMKRVKEGVDPQGLFSPGRFVGGI